MLLLLVFLVNLILGIDRPIIGVITQPTESTLGYSSLPSSYVKWIESGGAKVIPFFYDMNHTIAEYLFQGIHGFVFPGGGVDLHFGTPYMDLQKKIYDLAMGASENGDYFPIHGTCLGFESLVILSSQDDDILEYPFDSYNLSLPLMFQIPPNESRMFSFFPDEVVNTYKNSPVTLNNHHSGISTSKFLSNENLKDFYTLTTVNKGRGGKEFVSTIESKKYPIYGTQWHPEKVQFEDEPEAINHSFESVLANGYLSFFIVDEARKSKHAFSDPKEEEKYLIYNYSPTYTHPSGSEFDQMYYFPKSSEVFGF